MDGKLLGSDGKPLMPRRSVTLVVAVTSFSHAQPQHVDVSTPNLNQNDTTMKPVSYVNVVNPESNKPKGKFRTLEAENTCDGAEISIPRVVVEEISSRVQNSLYGYFLGRRISCGLIIRHNMWSKYGLSKVRMNAKGFFFFHFDTKKGMDDVLGNGPWMIRNVPIILKEWTLDTSLLKEDLTRVLLLNGSGYSKETIRIEYEWKPPRCDSCKMFGHSLNQCPKNIVEPTSVVDKSNDGLQEVTNKRPSELNKVVQLPIDDGFQTVFYKRRNGKGSAHNGKSCNVNRVGQGKFQFRPVGDSNATTSKGGNANTAKGGKHLRLLLSKEFDTAFEETSENDVENDGTGMSKVVNDDASDEEDEVEHVYDETSTFWRRHHPKVLS
ncbi:ATPase, F1/V1/A1 complex, alpha/beta subunit, Zinc knuckle CX2CX4HX4C [Artemisia annua]|uniref:ATPase, F1/V1/A1 complex, alpha/beta subunit, Zinc knuckle CX2CX4HX4C n=1 Tax=Artemisia annua TaxID=35608 RepID=A0A2U1LT23_ARTAN|nr:ATPase, F1/V1/A1 complex, alpha/beta subunit, Zinc knuckle CX2CX4HX4C [Artemisia annua]